MAKAIWNGEIIAESKKVKNVNGNTFFPPDSVKKEFLKKSYTKHIDVEIGTANYYNIKVGDTINWNGAWYYADLRNNKLKIDGFITFSSAVKIQ
ncbi:MAG TPA: DUF427 domain-containing protein [Ignavibacteriaceae bacterium]|nr:DUF427 domain-containing protein [Ignavibacteriaceae bacterium]